jgi:hypothetical protein
MTDAPQIEGLTAGILDRHFDIDGLQGADMFMA